MSRLLVSAVIALVMSVYASALPRAYARRLESRLTPADVNMPRLLDEGDGLGALSGPQLVPGRPGAVLEPMAGGHAQHRHQSNSLLSGVGIKADGESGAAPVILADPLLNDTIAGGLSVAAGLSTVLAVVTPIMTMTAPAGPSTSTHIVVVYPTSSGPTLPIVMATGGTGPTVRGGATAVLGLVIGGLVLGLCAVL